MDGRTCRWADLRVLVAGGGGFIGRAVVRELLARGARDVTVLSRHPGASPPGCRSLGVDLRDRAATAACLAGTRFDLVINAAGTIDQSTTPTIYHEAFEQNFATALHLVLALQDAGVGRFVHLGSNAEYGHAPPPHGSDTAERPVSAYGVAKLAATNLVRAKAHAEGFPGCVVRPFMVYGEGQSPRSLLSQVIDAARSRRELPTTPGEQTRDFVRVDRVARDVLAVAVAEPFAPGAVCNSCTGVETSVRDVLAHLHARYPGFRPRLGAVPYRAGELMRSVGVPLGAVSAAEARGELFDFLHRAIGGAAAQAG
jgi:nucleoside-diphosphate-sugar epimerase